MRTPLHQASALATAAFWALGVPSTLLTCAYAAAMCVRCCHVLTLLTCAYAANMCLDQSKLVSHQAAETFGAVGRGVGWRHCVANADRMARV